MSDKVIHVGDADFDTAVLQSGQPVLVDFWAEWCGPCKMISPVLDEIAAAYDGKLTVAKVNVDDAGGVAARYGVQSIPTLIVFKDGKPVKQFVGVQQAPTLIAALEAAK